MEKHRSFEKVPFMRLCAVDDDLEFDYYMRKSETKVVGIPSCSNEEHEIKGKALKKLMRSKKWRVFD